jgi:restriction system protein
MGRKQSRAGRDGLNRLLQKAIAALLVGVALLALPRIMPTSFLGRVIGEGARLPAEIALALGVLLVALYGFLRSRRSKPMLGYQADSTSWAPPETLTRNEPGFADAYVPPSTVRTRRVAPADTPERRAARAWNHRVLEEIGGRRFQAMCEQLFAQGGFEVRAEPLGGEAGVVLSLQSRNSPSTAGLVQCRHSRKPVGTQDLNEFFGLMAARKLKRGVFATNATFTPEAQKFARDHGINAMNRDRLLELIAKRTPQQQQHLLEIALEAD